MRHARRRQHGILCGHSPRSAHEGHTLRPDQPSHPGGCGGECGGGPRVKCLQHGQRVQGRAATLRAEVFPCSNFSEQRWSRVGKSMARHPIICECPSITSLCSCSRFFIAFAMIFSAKIPWTELYDSESGCTECSTPSSAQPQANRRYSRAGGRCTFRRPLEASPAPREEGPCRALIRPLAI